MILFTSKNAFRVKLSLGFGLITLMLVTASAQTNSTAPVSASTVVPPAESTSDSSIAPKPLPEPVAPTSGSVAPAAEPISPAPTAQSRSSIRDVARSDKGVGAQHSITPTFSADTAPPPSSLSSTAENFPFPPNAASALLIALGFLFFYTGSTRAKNCGHTASAILIGSMLGLIAFWAGGFAVELGGIGDVNPSLALPFVPEQKTALGHELTVVAGGHRWGLMGSEGFFLDTIAEAKSSVASLFLVQIGPLLATLLIALGGGLERVRLSALGVFAALAGTLVLPLVVNWIVGGGWLATLGLEFGLGHGMVDFGGSCYLAEAGGALALALSLSVGPRIGRFVAGEPGRDIPGHHLPFAVIGALLLVGAIQLDLNRTSMSALGTINLLLAAAGGVVGVALLGLQGRSLSPLLLCRGLLAGAIAVSGAASLYETWIAFGLGLSAGLVVEVFGSLLARQKIDDPAGSIAIFLGAGCWGTLAVGLLTDGAGTSEVNGVAGPIAGLITGDWHQLAAQATGVLACFVVTFGLGLVAAGLIQRVVGLRVPARVEEQGLDASQIGALGYQADAD